jgi:hypothetical protein
MVPSPLRGSVQSGNGRRGEQTVQGFPRVGGIWGFRTQAQRWRPGPSTLELARRTRCKQPPVVRFPAAPCAVKGAATAVGGAALPLSQSGSSCSRRVGSVRRRCTLATHDCVIVKAAVRDTGSQPDASSCGFVAETSSVVRRAPPLRPVVQWAAWRFGVRSIHPPGRRLGPVKFLKYSDPIMPVWIFRTPTGHPCALSLPSSACVFR